MKLKAAQFGAGAVNPQRAFDVVKTLALGGRLKCHADQRAITIGGEPQTVRGRKRIGEEHVRIRRVKLHTGGVIEHVAVCGEQLRSETLESVSGGMARSPDALVAHNLAGGVEGAVVLHPVRVERCAAGAEL